MNPGTNTVSGRTGDYIMLQTTESQLASVARTRNRRSEQASMRHLYWITFPLCLVVASIRRIVLLFSSQAERPDRSIIAEARSAAYAAVGYAFHA